ncbi:MAG: hypothetical protein K2X87_31575 [Gemmataceae bacterium]|nr:hypothetical protein [Gemmataceae bacterium]
MPQLVVDATLHEKLGLYPGPVRLVDAAGNVLGVFTPTPGVVDGLEPPPLPEEELRRREAEPGGRTWAEIRADLEKRG